jgi:hypothetical protein
MMSCGSEEVKRSDGSEFNPSENSKLEKEIMRLHDEQLMPEMKNIQLMMNQLENRIKDDTSGYSETYKVELDAAHQGLEDSYEEMMNWMAKYSPDSRKDSPGYKMYLIEERGKLYRMKDSFNENIAYAKSTLENEKFKE